MRILLVDDDDDIREMLAMILRAQGHEVDMAEDGVVALDRLRAGPRPALMILDMMMPRLDGEGVLRAMRSDPRLAAVPVVLLSGHQGGREQAARLGVGCLIKPVELSDLLAVVDRAGGSSGADATS